MTAGQGIVHSERTRAGGAGRMFGMQTWVALPKHLEECAPTFEHYAASAVPLLEEGGVTTRLIAARCSGPARRCGPPPRSSTPSPCSRRAPC